jgi:hypothetical protein
MARIEELSATLPVYMVRRQRCSRTSPVPLGLTPVPGGIRPLTGVRSSIHFSALQSRDRKRAAARKAVCNRPRAPYFSIARAAWISICLSDPAGGIEKWPPKYSSNSASTRLFVQTNSPRQRVGAGLRSFPRSGPGRLAPICGVRRRRQVAPRSVFRLFALREKSDSLLPQPQERQ